MHMNLKPNKHKIISFNTTTMTSLGFIIVENPPLPLFKSEAKVRFLLLLFSSLSFESAMQDSDASFCCTKT